MFLAELSSVFGIGLILWYFWIAMMLLRLEVRVECGHSLQHDKTERMSECARDLYSY